MQMFRADALAQLAPGGSLRAAIAVGAASSAVWNTVDPATGAFCGVSADLARALSEWLGLDLRLVAFPSSGAIIEAAEADVWDVGFVPVDAERKKHVAFSANYFLGESTYMVRAGSTARTVQDVDAPGIRVVGIEGTATLRSARKTLQRATAQETAKLDDALALFSSGEADALALSRESIASLLPRFPGAYAVAGHFHATGTAVAVRPGRPLAVDIVDQFVREAILGGLLRTIFDRNGLAGAAVPPPGSRS